MFFNLNLSFNFTENFLMIFFFHHISIILKINLLINLVNQFFNLKKIQIEITNKSGYNCDLTITKTAKKPQSYNLLKLWNKIIFIASKIFRSCMDEWSRMIAHSNKKCLKRWFNPTFFLNILFYFFNLFKQLKNISFILFFIKTFV